MRLFTVHHKVFCRHEEQATSFLNVIRNLCTYNYYKIDIPSSILELVIFCFASAL